MNRNGILAKIIYHISFATSITHHKIDRLLLIIKVTTARIVIPI